ncbi:MAG TPA: ethanolamine ammonia-lyase subunit EutC [Bryobacteraceae bacterium]|nr:ethanolamine ammonia-lyase subunit EutC [Bryobacteraceae bacterium]
MEDPWTSLRELTFARIALGRAGHSLPTREILAFQLAHARARDAVHRTLEPGEFPNATRLHSAARDRAEYVRRPDLGRRLDAASAERIKRGDWDAVIIIADGLSATAVHRHAQPVIDALLPLLEGWRMAPLCVAEQARVAIADEIGERIGAALSVILIGERPGLSSPDSLGAYLTWSPRVGRTDAERNCVSNIRPEGLEPKLAAERIAMLMRAARERRLSGVALSAQLAGGPAIS